MSKSKFLVSWINGEDLGVYEATDEEGAVLAAICDAGYSSLEKAKDFIYDARGGLTLEANILKEQAG